MCGKREVSGMIPDFWCEHLGDEGANSEIDTLGEEQILTRAG